MSTPGKVKIMGMKIERSVSKVCPWGMVGNLSQYKGLLIRIA